MVKSPLALQEPQEMQFRSLSQEDPLEEEMATHSHILVWETHTQEPGWVWSMELQRVGHAEAAEHECTRVIKVWSDKYLR